MRYLIPTLSFILLVIPLSLVIIDPVNGLEEGDLITRIDLEDSDGGITHGGDMDRWEWGIPGPGSTENPGPGSSGEGERCLGSPLNGTYQEGTRSYLDVPEIDVHDHRYITVTYLIWFDLSFLDDEKNSTGIGNTSDHFLVQVRNDPGSWTTVMNHSGSSGGDWVDQRIDLSSFNIEKLILRFLLVDVEDGSVDNGVFIDEIIIEGILRPVVEIELSEPPEVPRFIPTWGISRIHFTVLNEGMMTPSDSEVSLLILGPPGWGPFTTSKPISSERISTDHLDWEPLMEGNYELYLNLTVEGSLGSSYHYPVTAMDTVLYDDMSNGLDHWRIDTEEGDSTWFIEDVTPGPSTTSGEGHLRFGSPGGSGTSIGFSGNTHSYITSPLIDLRFMDNAYLYIQHSFGFIGEQGSCGGSVKAVDPTGNWVTLESDQPHTRILKEGISGPLEGEHAFQGDRDWYQIGFDLDALIGDHTRLRFIVSSGETGEGRGWWIDDIFVTGEGADPFDTDPPEPVQGIKVEIIDEGWVEVEWTPSFALDLAYYNVYVGTGSDGILNTDLRVQLQAENDTVVSFMDLDPELSYWVAVTAVDRSGNEDRSVDVIRFTPSTGSGDQDPVAIARIVGSNYGDIGDEFILNGSSSFDPDGVIISYIWDLPDGSRLEGKQVRWKSSISGDGLVVTLTVQDTSGGIGTTNVTLNIKDRENTDLQTEDLYSFILCMSPIIVSLIVIVILVAWFRRSRQKKIRRQLLRMGLDADPSHEYVHAEIIDTSSKQTRGSSEKKIMDLVPVHTIHSHRSKSKDKERPVEPKKAAPLKSVHREEAVTDRSKEIPREKEVSALVECPFCGNSFKASVNREKLMSGEPFDIKCSNCGRSGQVG